MDRWETLELLATLLDYPGNHMGDMENMAGEIGEFLDNIIEIDPYELQELYVNTFEMSGKVSLYVTRMIYRDDDERSELMLKLIGIYGKYRFKFDRHELPDYLPTMLTFISTHHNSIPIATLRELSSLIYSASINIKDRIPDGNPYKLLIDALVKLMDDITKQLK